MENIIKKLPAEKKGNVFGNKSFTAIAMMAAAEAEEAKKKAIEHVKELVSENNLLKKRIVELEEEIKSVKIELFNNPLMGNSVDRIHGL